MKPDESSILACAVKDLGGGGYDNTWHRPARYGGLAPSISSGTIVPLALEKLGGGLMAVLLEQTLPEGASMEMLDEVSAEMGVDTEPPAGLVVHVHLLQNGRVRVVDVWESADAFENFNRDRLEPALRRVLERHGMKMEDAPPPETSMVEVHAVVKG
jgi:hypothetical protein